MKLLELSSWKLREFSDTTIPKFAILSSGRGDTYHTQDWSISRSTQLREQLTDSWIIKAADHLALLGITHVWAADVCISPGSSAERDEAANGVLRRLKKAEVCYVYLHDLPADGPSYNQDIWKECSFWKQSRTLPDLLIPPKVEFFDKEWVSRGSKASPELASLISNITNIPSRVLLDSSTLADIGLGVRISWGAGRTASFEEDTAYYLAPILDISIQPRYGEGRERAFLRLQQELLQDFRDGSVFAWISEDEKEIRGLFARSPEEFRHFSGPQKKYQWEGPWPISSKIRFSSRGIEIQAQTYKLDPYIVVDIGNSEPNLSQSKHRRVGIILRNWGGVYVRAKPGLHSVVFSTAPFQMIDVVRSLDDRTASKIRSYFESKDKDSNINTIPQTEQHQILTLTRKASPGRRPADDVSDTSAKNENRSRNTTPISAQRTTGIKRDRYGRPIPSSESHQDQAGPASRSYHRPASDSESSDSDSGNSSDSGDDDDEDDDDEDAEELGEDHELQAIRPSLVQFVYSEAKTWINSATYTTPPEDRLPPKKRCRTIDWNSPSGLVKYEAGNDDKVIAHRFEGYYHLACPYYIAKPGKYSKCLLGHDLQSVEHVIRHLIQHHKEPPYCPICRREFEKPWVRDQHVRVRTCTFQSSGDVDGVNERQRYKLRKRDRVHLGEQVRWRRVWGTVFPDVSPPESPYLEGGVDVAMSMMRDYWANRGPKLAEEYLDDSTRSDSHDIRALNAFNRLILEDLLAKVWEDPDFRTGDEGTGNTGDE